MPASPRRRIPAARTAPAPVRGRRRQADRTADTRRRIIAAVVACIDELGFQKTTASEITRRAGVTWGAVQHHFGGKDGILTAVLEDSFERFASRIADLPAELPSLEERVAWFVARAWEHFGSPHYRSTFEILLSYAQDGDERSDGPGWQEAMLRAWDDVWRRVFADVSLPRASRTRLQHYTVAVLSGLASMKVIEGAAGRSRASELRLLEETLLRELRRGQASSDQPSGRRSGPKEEAP
jgi:AcrR family transcriptional regulator